MDDFKPTVAKRNIVTGLPVVEKGRAFSNLHCGTDKGEGAHLQQLSLGSTTLSKISYMQTVETSSCSISTSCSTRSFDVPDTSHGPQNVALSSIQTDGAPKTRTIAIAVKAHEKLRLAPFDYAFHYLAEQRNCKMVVISCLSRLRDEMGLDRVVDVETFGGVSKKKLEAAIDEQILNLNYFLKGFRNQLEKKGIPLDIRVTAGPKSADILVQAARAIRPHWLVLDLRFSGAQKTIQAALDCNLVLMKKNPKKGQIILRLSDSYLGPASQIQNDQLCEEDPGLGMEVNHGSSSRGWSSPSSHYTGTNGAASTRISNVESTPLTSATQTSSKSSKMHKCITCMCFGSEPTRAAVVADADGPTEKQTVLYGPIAPGNKATYLGKVGNPSMISDPPIVPTRIASPEDGPPSNFFNLGGESGRSKSSQKALRLIEQQLEAQMASAPEEEDGRFQLQL